MAIRKSKELSSLLKKSDSIGDDIIVGETVNRIVADLLIYYHTLANGGTTLHSTKYHLLPTDLRLPASSSFEQLRSILRPDCPTLVLCECVLVYMSPSQSSSIVQWFAEYTDSAPLGVVVYEMFKLGDPFGKMMKNNLKVSFILTGVSFLNLQSKDEKGGVARSRAVSNYTRSTAPF